MAHRSNDVLNLEEEARKQRIRRWICGDETQAELESTRQYDEALRQRHEGTGDWVWSQEAFKAWYDSKDSGTTSLCMVAAAGSGKTVLAAEIARRIHSDGHNVATFFCSYHDSRRRNSEFALRSLALQLLRLTLIPDTVTELLERDIRSGKESMQGIPTAARVVEGLVKNIPRVHIIFDGLDELRDWDASISNLQDLFRALSNGITKWFMTTRQDRIIRKDLASCNVTLFDAPEISIKKDIETFLKKRAFADSESPSFEDLEIEVEGNFLWATFLLDIVKKADFVSTEAIRTELGRVSPGLQGLYLRTLEQRLSKLKGSKRDLAEKLIAFLVAAQQPLRLSELTQALGESTSLDVRRPKKPLTRESIEDLGSHLVVIEEDEKVESRDYIVRFAHKTVYDFFVDEAFEPPPRLSRFFVSRDDAHRSLGLACFNYICNARYANPKNIGSLMKDEKHAFLCYSAAYWYHHLDAINKPPDTLLISSINSFMNSPNFWTCVAVQSCIAPFIFGRFDRTKTGLRWSSGADSSKSDAVSVGLGYPLPKFVRTERAKAFLQFILQWYRVLNTWPDKLEHCYMGSQWDSEWPDFRKWIDSRDLVPTHLFLHNDGDINANTERIQQLGLIRSIVRPCHVLSQIFNASLLDPKELHAGLHQAHVCVYCAVAFDETMDNQGSSLRASSAALEDELLRLILQTSSQYLVGEGWTMFHLDSSITAVGSPRSFEALAVSYVQNWESSADQYSQSSGESDDESDNELGTEDDVSETLEKQRCCTVLHRPGLSPITYTWISIARTKIFPKFAFDGSGQQIAWTVEHGRLCIMGRTSNTIQKFALEEPMEAHPGIRSMYRDVRFSANGERMWYLLLTVERTEVGWCHRLFVSAFDIIRTKDVDFQMRRTSTRGIVYQSTGSVNLPGILASWAEDFVFLALPPLTSMPKFLRIALTPESSSKGVQFETLQSSIFFPSSTNSREPTLHHMPLNSADLLMLSLAAEAAPEQDPCNSFGERVQSLQEDGVLQDDMRNIVWRIDRSEGWRAWNHEQDGHSDEYRTTIDGLAQHFRGTYVNMKRSFRVTVRTSLDWRRQACLSCF